MGLPSRRRLGFCGMGVTVVTVGLDQRTMVAASTFRVEGLGEVIVHARCEATFAIPLQGVRGERNDRQAREILLRLPVPDFAGRAVAVKDWHLAVHQHQVGALALDGFDRFPAIRNAETPMARKASSISLATS